MQSYEEITTYLQKFPETTELPHFDKISFRVRKKIFATLDTKNQRMTLKLSLIDQDVFSAIGKSVIYPVGNSWGKQGWTIFELGSVQTEVLQDALKQAYRESAPTSLGMAIGLNFQ